ncbi:NAD(P)H-hydrate dehydratase [Streptomyces sp. NPDC060194]|uniref:NAD(P)H-hydrate dehydratase n=1 Tax=Streptomyces sp. NPDC060194 TaxID=3347069 RepID=UPI0036486A13
MRQAYSVERVRSAERELMAALPDGALMARAAAGLAATCTRLLRRTGKLYATPVTLLVGTGDNGADTLLAGARLAHRGAAVRAVLLNPDRTHPTALATFLRSGGRLSTDPLADIARAALVLDGITGIGGKGALRDNAVPLARAAAASAATTVAVDVPSGVDADTGEVAGEAVRADVTVTFGAYKPGLLVDPGRGHAGTVHLVDIGLDIPGAPDAESPQHADVAALLPGPTAESDKYRRGVVGVVAGSRRYPGAAVLAVAGALHGGAGAVRYVGSPETSDAVLARFPEVLVGTGRVQSWAVGPGLGDEPDARAAVADALASDVPVLLDADGLGLADPAAVRARTAPTLLTPHAGEAARLLGVERSAVEAARLAHARRLAAEFSATVLLKGSTTVIASSPAAPGLAAPVRANPTGTPWLATAGSGDVLSGLTASLLATGLSAPDAAATGAYLHGLAGRTASDGAPATAMTVAAELAAAWRSVTG